MTRPTLFATLNVALLLGGSLAASAQTPQAPNPTDTAISAAQTQLDRAQARYQEGISSASDVSDAKMALALARIRGAVANGKMEAVPSEVAVLQEQRQEQVKRCEAQYAAGILSVRDLNQAKAALLKARISSNLFDLWLIEHQTVQQLQEQQRAGVVSRTEVDKATSAANKALDQFTASLPTKGEILP
jgi:outer membrane protein TolC